MTDKYKKATCTYAGGPEIDPFASMVSSHEAGKDAAWTYRY